MQLAGTFALFSWIWAIAESQPCHNMLEQYRLFLRENLPIVDAPFGYEPRCESDGRFKAEQRHAIHLFCVDTITGEKIPDTQYDPSAPGEPISEQICQAYSNLWQRYKLWLEENDIEELDEHYVTSIDEQTCPEGFEYHASSCEKHCIAGSNMSERWNFCSYSKPVCRCPNGFYEFNKTCITNEACMALEPEPFTLDIKETLWNTYMLLNSNDILKRHWEAEDKNELRDIFAIASSTDARESEDQNVQNTKATTVASTGATRTKSKRR